MTPADVRVMAVLFWLSVACFGLTIAWAAQARVTSVRVDKDGTERPVPPEVPR